MYGNLPPLTISVIVIIIMVVVIIVVVIVVNGLHLISHLQFSHLNF